MTWHPARCSASASATVPSTESCSRILHDTANAVSAWDGMLMLMRTGRGHGISQRADHGGGARHICSQIGAVRTCRSDVVVM